MKSPVSVLPYDDARYELPLPPRMCFLLPLPVPLSLHPVSEWSHRSDEPEYKGSADGRTHRITSLVVMLAQFGDPLAGRKMEFDKPQLASSAD